MKLLVKIQILMQLVSCNKMDQLCVRVLVGDVLVTSPHATLDSPTAYSLFLYHRFHRRLRLCRLLPSRETCFRLVDVSSVFSVLDGGQRTEVRGHVL